MRYRQQSLGDVAGSMELDGAFVGVDNRREPGLLAIGTPGMLADSLNVRIRDGQPRTRPGSFPPVHFNPTFTALRGSGIFSDPQSKEWLLAADYDKVWMLADGQTPMTIALPAGVTLQSAVELVQCFDRVVMFRGKDLDPLEWNGDRFQAFTSVVPNAPDPERPGFISPTPRADFGVVMADRLWVPISRDEVAWSDVLDYTKFDLSLATLRCNRGEDDSIVALAPYQGRRLVVFKDQSIYIVEGVFGELAALTVDRLAVRFGCKARKSVADVNGDLYFLSEGGVYSLTQTEQSEVRAVPVPISWPIQGWIDRINWTYAHLAAAVVDTANHLYMLSVPIDGSTVNNAILVYDTVTRNWHGMDTFGTLPREVVPELPTAGAWSYDPIMGPAGLWPDYGTPVAAVDVGNMVTTDLFGRRTVFLVEPQRITALGHGTRDELGGFRYPLQTRVQTRGYILGELGIKQLRSVMVALATLDAEITIELLTDGPGEVVTLLHKRRRDRLRYTVHGKGRWDASNRNDDFSAPRREDYIWRAEDGCELRSGIPLSRFQEWIEAHAARAEGRWFALRITCTHGEMILRNVQAEGTMAKPTMRSQT